MRTLVTCLVDRSGSMNSIRDNTISGFNEYLDVMRKSDSADQIYATLLIFDSTSLDKVFVNMPVKDAPVLDHATFVPRHGTPLIDAVYKTILAVEKIVDKDTKPVIAIMTDGYENQSTQFTYAELAELVGKKTNEGWQFTFMGSGFDAYAQSARLGIRAGATISYSGGKGFSNAGAWSASGTNTANYASGAAATMDFMEEQRLEVGDQFAQQAPQQNNAPIASPTIGSIGPDRYVTIADFEL